MSFIAAAVIGGVGALAGGMISANAAKNAAKTQADAANQATQLQRDQFDRAAELNEPWRQAGIGALNKLTTASDYTPFGMDQFQADPGYAFRMSEGQKALERSAAARGMQLSGAMLKGTQRFGQDLASQEYTNAFNRYQTERAAKLQPLQALAGIGQSATNQVTNAGQNYATNAGDMMTSGAAARASGYVGGANALNSALGSAGNSYMSGQMLNRLMPARTPMVDPYSYYTPAQYNYAGIE
jgi:hypothetical protein